MNSSDSVLTCDYLVIGAGTANLSFVDTFLDRLPDATFTLVDRSSRPGGHWTTAYPLVRLLQASAAYGVNSLPLGKNRTRKGIERFDTTDRATGKEICEYYAKVVENFLATKRVKVYFNTEYTWNEDTNRHQLTSILDGKIYHVESAGKSGTDAISYLLASGIDQSAITWIISRDVWYLLRDGLWPSSVPGRKYHANVATGFLDPLLKASNVDEFYLFGEKAGSFGRIDPSGPTPKVFRGATIDTSELQTLRTVENTVRLGRITSISSCGIILERGSIPFSVDSTLVVDCISNENSPLFGYLDYGADFRIFNAGRIRLGPL